MPRLKDVRNSLLIAHNNSLLSDEELLLLLDENSSENPQFNYDKYERFNIINLHQLAEVLQLPNSFRCHQRTTADKLEGLCILLRKMSYPCRYSDMIPRFGRPVAELSMITNNVMDYIYDVHGHRLTEWNNDILNPGLLEMYADAVAQKGAALTNCFGFIDGTVRPICRPTQYQKIVFNGHKRVHSLKFQSVTLPNGLIANLFGPVGAYLELANIFKSYNMDYMQL